MITVAQAAEELGVSRWRIHQLIKAGRLPAQRFGREMAIQEQDLELVRERKPGRPVKGRA